MSATQVTQSSPTPTTRPSMRPKRKRATTYRAAGKLANKRCLVTGGSRGIGRAVALLFAREGAEVAIAYRPEDKKFADQVVEEIVICDGRAIAVACDLAEPHAIQAMVDRAVEFLGGLDVVVNNAAIADARVTSKLERDAEMWQRTVVDVYLAVANASLRHLTNGGSIINTGMITGLEGFYATTKRVIEAFTKSLALQLGACGVRVNCVAPGPVWTPLGTPDRQVSASYEGQTRNMAVAPYGQPAQPESIAPAYVFFASAADSGFITGEVLNLLGSDIRAAGPTRGRVPAATLR